MITENIKIIREKINEACVRASRDISTIRLVAVSKTYPVDAIKQAIDSEVFDFGENKAQEFKDKAENISEDVRWHFIGHLQTNKVKYVIKSAEYIHSVESEKLADEINKRAAGLEKIQKILLEVNTSKEASKFGIETEDELKKILAYCSKCENLKVAGLMTMAPYTDDESVIGIVFRD